MNDTVEERVLRSSRGKWFLTLIGSGLFVAGGWRSVLNGNWSGWPAVVFFGLCGIVSAFVLLSGGPYLRITSDGFTVCFLLRSFTYLWNDIERFQMARIAWTRKVVFNFVADYDKHAASRRIARWFAGHEGALSDAYGMPCEELVALLNRYREHASAGFPVSSKRGGD